MTQVAGRTASCVPSPQRGEGQDEGVLTQSICSRVRPPSPHPSPLRGEGVRNAPRERICLSAAASAGEEGRLTMAGWRKKPKRRGLYNKRTTPDEQVVQRELAFAAIRGASTARRCRYGAPARAGHAGGTSAASAMPLFASSAAGRSWRRSCKNGRTIRSWQAVRAGCRRRRTGNGSCAVSRHRTSCADARAAYLSPRAGRGRGSEASEGEGASPRF